MRPRRLVGAAEERVAGPKRQAPRIRVCASVDERPAARVARRRLEGARILAAALRARLLRLEVREQVGGREHRARSFGEHARRRLRARDLRQPHATRARVADLDKRGIEVLAHGRILLGEDALLGVTHCCSQLLNLRQVLRHLLDHHAVVPPAAFNVRDLHVRRHVGILLGARRRRLLDESAVVDEVRPGRHGAGGLAGVLVHWCRQERGPAQAAHRM